MEQFWQKDKYRLSKKFSKSTVIRELEKGDLIGSQYINSLPSYSSLSSVFKDIRGGALNNLEEMKNVIRKRIDHKTTRRRKHQWEYKGFDEKLVQRIEEFNDQDELRFWIEAFKEYYKLLKSENKND